MNPTKEPESPQKTEEIVVKSEDSHKESGEPKEEWKKEYRKEFDVKIVPAINPVRPVLNCPDAEMLELFIEKKISQAKSQGAREALEGLENDIQTLVWQIEKCGASPELTKAVIMAGEIREKLQSRQSNLNKD